MSSILPPVLNPVVRIVVFALKVSTWILLIPHLKQTSSFLQLHALLMFLEHSLTSHLEQVSVKYVCNGLKDAFDIGYS